MQKFGSTGVVVLGVAQFVENAVWTLSIKQLGVENNSLREPKSMILIDILASQISGWTTYPGMAWVAYKSWWRATHDNAIITK